MLLPVPQIFKHFFLSFSNLVLLLKKTFGFFHHGFFSFNHFWSSPVRSNTESIEYSSAVKTCFICISAICQKRCKSFASFALFVTLLPLAINAIIPNFIKKLHVMPSSLCQCFLIIRSVFKSFVYFYSRIIKRFQPWVCNIKVPVIFLIKFIKCFCFSPNLFRELPIKQFVFWKGKAIQITSISRSRTNG